MIQRPDRTTILRNATNPVLFVAGEQDSAILLEDSLKQCHLPERCDFHILKNSGHMSMIEEPEELSRILESFLRDTEISP